MKGIKLLTTLLTLFSLWGCLPDSLTKFDEDPPSDPYAVAPTYATEAPPAISYDKEGPHKLNRFIPAQANSSSQTEEEEDDTSFSTKMYSSTSSEPFSDQDEMTFSISPDLPTGLILNTKTGEISGQPTNFKAKTTFTVTGSHPSPDDDVTTDITISVTTKIDSLSYTIKANQKVRLVLDSIEKIEGKFYLHNNSSLFSSYHPIIPGDTHYQTIINQKGSKADITADSINDTYNTLVAIYKNDTAEIFKAGDSIDVGPTFFSTKNKIKKVIYLINDSDSTIDLSPKISPSLGTDETADYSVSPPISNEPYLFGFSPTDGTVDSGTIPSTKFLPTQFNFIARNQNGETASTSLWISYKTDTDEVINAITYNITADDMFKITVDDSSNFSTGGSLSTKNEIKASIISNKNNVLQIKITDSTTESTLAVGTGIDNSSDFIWPETTILSTERIYKVDESIDATPDNWDGLTDFKIEPDEKPNGLNFDATSGTFHGKVSQEIKNVEYKVTAKNILGEKVSGTFKFSIINPPEGLSYSRDVILVLEEDSSIDSHDIITSSSNAKGLVKQKIINTPSKPFLLVKVLEGEFKPDEQIDNSYTYTKPMGTISEVEYYNAAFVINKALDSTQNENLIMTSGSSETTSDNLAEIVYIDPTSDPAGVYVRIVKGSFKEGSSYSINDAVSTSITINDISSDNLLMDISGTDTQTFFQGAYVTTGATTDTNTFLGSGIVNYSAINGSDATASINIIYGDATTSGAILNSNPFETTTDAKTIAGIQTDHLFNAYANESVRFVPKLNKGTGTTLAFSISPNLSSGLNLNPSTGIIEGTPLNGLDTTTYTVTTYNDSGDTTHDFKLKIHEHFQLRIKEGSSETSNAILHREGQGHNRLPCRVTLDQLNNDPSTNTKDIVCYYDVGESDLNENGASFEVVTSGLCPFVEHLPFGFFKKQYKKSTGTTLYEHTGSFTDDTCKALINNGEEIPPYSIEDGSADAFTKSYASWDELCNNECDDGTISVTTLTYTQSGEKLCFNDSDNDGFYDKSEDLHPDATNDSDCASKTNGIWNYRCLRTTSSSSRTETCTGTKLKCMSGPLTEIPGITPNDIKSRLGEVKATNGNLTFSYKAPSNISDDDISSDTNIYLANFTKNNQCALNTSAYTYDDATWDALTKNSVADASSDPSAGRFNEANPFYTYNCLTNTGEIKARIRLMIREWNRPFQAKDYVDRINPDALIDGDFMDSTADTDAGYLNEKWNNFSDFDDISNDAASCSSSLIKYPF